MSVKRKRKNLVQTLISDETLAALEKQAESRDVTMSQLLREAIAYWLSDRH